jgi:hypothetical protein
MPDIISKTQDFAGFPKGQYFSENMKKGEFGLGNLYKHMTLASSSTLTGLADVKSYSDIVLDIFGSAGTGPTNAIAAQDSNGVIYVRNMGSDTWSVYYKPGHTASATGIHWDGRYFYYMGTEKIGRADMSNLTYVYDTGGTVSVTNGSATVTGSGTNFNSAAQNNKRIRIGTDFYTISSVASATSLTLTTNYTGATASGVAYQAFGSWDDNWQDAGAALTGYLNFQPFSYQGDIVFPRQGRISRYNFTDDSFNADSSGLFTAPSGYYWRCGSGGQNGILLGLEPIRGGASYLVLWDNRSIRSVAPWIPLTSTVQSIEPYNGGWIVVTQREIIFTNGYSARVLSEGFDTKLGESSFAVIPNGLKVVDDRAIICNAIGGYTKKRSGVYVYDIKENAYEYIAPLGGHTYDVTPLAVYMDMNKAINVSYSTLIPARKYLTKLSDEAAPRGYVITKPIALDGNAKYLGAVKADFAIVEGADSITGTITASVAPLNRRVWGVQKAKTAGADTTHIVVNGTLLNDVQVGDEITVMEGVNAGTTRHVTAISGAGTATETWTLDSALSVAIEADAHISVTPFQKVAEKTVTAATELRDMLFNSQNRYKGKQYLVKLGFSGLTVPVEVLQVGLIAQTQGERT